MFDSIDVLYYDLNKISLSRDKSSTDSPQWLKNKKATINPKNNDNRCFQFAVTVVLNYEQIKKDPQRISIQLERDFSSHKKDWNEFEKNNETIVLNILYVPHNTKEIRHAYKSKYNLNCENRVILLMITDGKKWYYLAVKGLPTLLKGITSNTVKTFTV